MASAEEFVDPYLDPETGILRNKVGARTQAALNEAEGDLTFARLVQLMDHPPKPTGDLDELRAIHRHLFQDLYEWAGELRVVKLRKRVKGGEFFLHPFDIGRGAGFSADELRRDNMLRGMNRDRFIDRLACHYGNFNHVHPFREGNGRTQRVFWSRVARDAGWQIDWRRVRGKTNNEACRAADREDLGPLREMFDQIVTKATPARGRDDTWRVAERARLSFPKGATRTGRNRPEGPSSAPPPSMPGKGYGAGGPGAER
jgi:cell filamentation protein